MRESGDMGRTLGLAGATGVGVGAIVGGGILVLAGVGFETAGPGILAAFALNGCIAFLTALSFAQMASAFPASGGAYTFAKRVVSVQAAFGVGWVVWFASIAASVLYAIGFSSYVLFALERVWSAVAGAPPAWLTGRKMLHAVAVGVVVLYTVTLTRKTTGGGQFATIGKLVVFAVLILGGLWALKDEPGPQVTASLSPFLPHGTLGLLQAMGFTFVALQGFDIIAAVGGEVQDPSRTIPRAMLLSLVLAMLVYLPLLLVIATVGVKPGGSIVALSTSNRDTLVAVAARNFLGDTGLWLVVAAAMLSTLSALYANLLAASRVGLAMARDRTLPVSLGKLHAARGTPVRAIVMSFAAVVVILLLIPGVAAAGAASSLIFLLCFGLVHGMNILAHRNAGPEYTPFRLPGFPLIPVVGGTACVGLAVFQGIAVPSAGLIVSAWLLVGGLLFLFLFARRAEVFDASEEAREPKLSQLRGRSPLVLVPIANPANAEAMVGVASALAPPRVGRVLLLSVVKMPPHEAPDDWPPLLSQAQKVLRESLVASFSSGLAPEALTTLARDPWLEIARVARVHRCESLLLGLSDLNNPMAGAYLEQLMSSVSCDVVVLRALQGWSPADVRRILVPLGGRGAHDRLRARLIGSLLRNRPCEVCFVRLLPPDTDPYGVARAEGQLAVLAQDEVPGPCRLEVARCENVADEIARRAEHADLVILGLQREGPRRKSFGEISLRVAESTRCGIIMISRGR